MENIRKQIVEIVKRSKRILLMPSTPVDGDSLGSSLALYLVLKKLEKEVTVVCADPVPEAFQFLPTTKVISGEFTIADDFIVTLDCKKAKINTIRTKLEQDKVNIIITAKKGQFSKEDVSFNHGPSKYDLIITVDTGDLSQLGRFYEDNTGMFSNIPLINIDHHASNNHFGRINYVDIMASATTEMLIQLIADFEKEEEKKLMDEDIATLLLAGIITDTGSFQNANTTPRSFAASALLIKFGARQQEIIQHVFKTKNLSTLKLWGRILSKIKVNDQHNIVWSVVSNRDLHETHSTPDETGGIIDELLSNAPGSEIVILIKEKDEGIISGSVRTTNASIDASAVAEMFGGGGHTRAAGFKIKSDDLEKTEKMIIEKICEFQEKRHKAAQSFNYEQDTDNLPKVEEATENINKEDLTSSTNQSTPNNKTVEKKTKIPVETKKNKKRKAEDFTSEFVLKASEKAEEEAGIEEGIIYKFED